MAATFEKLIAPDVYDRLSDRLGGALATEVLVAIREYVRTHDCALAGIDVEYGNDVCQIAYHHQPGCPAARNALVCADSA